MVDLAEECLRILNEGHFQIVEPGPLSIGKMVNVAQEGVSLRGGSIPIASISSASGE